MTMLEQLETLWSTIDKESGQLPGTYQRRIPESGALSLYASILRPEGRRKISAHVSAAACSHLNLSSGGKGFELVIEEQAQNNMAVLHLEERPGASNAIFSMVCADLISASKTSTDVAGASASFCNRLMAWKRFFEALGDRGITREEYVGLWGELHFVNSMMKAGTPPPDALRAWLGSGGAPQDFSFGTRAIEVKTSAGAEMGVLNISNIMQLDDSLLSELYLVCCHCDFRPEAGVTMSELREEISAQLGPALKGSFEDSLISRGLSDPDSSPWKGWGFRVLSDRAYRVHDAFPRLKANDVPSGVVDVAYSIQLGACADYRVDFAGVLSTARFFQEQT